MFLYDREIQVPCTQVIDRGGEITPTIVCTIIVLLIQMSAGLAKWLPGQLSTSGKIKIVRIASGRTSIFSSGHVIAEPKIVRFVLLERDGCLMKRLQSAAEWFRSQLLHILSDRQCGEGKGEWGGCESRWPRFFCQGPDQSRCEPRCCRHHVAMIGVSGMNLMRTMVPFVAVSLAEALAKAMYNRQ